MTATTRKARRTMQGIVVSAKGDKTLVVRVTRRVRHPLYDRFIKKSTKLHVHDEENSAGEGDTVRVVSTRPLTWRVPEALPVRLGLLAERPPEQFPRVAARILALRVTLRSPTGGRSLSMFARGR